MSEQQPDMVTVYVGIGNSDDKLTQVEWSTFVDALRAVATTYRTGAIIGEWFSLPDARYQNAEFAWAMLRANLDLLRADLTELRTITRQDSIALAIVARTEFV